MITFLERLETRRARGEDRVAHQRALRQIEHTEGIAPPSSNFAGYGQDFLVACVGSGGRIRTFVDGFKDRRPAFRRLLSDCDTGGEGNCTPTSTGRPVSHGAPARNRTEATPIPRACAIHRHKSVVEAKGIEPSQPCVQDTVLAH